MEQEVRSAISGRALGFLLYLQEQRRQTQELTTKLDAVSKSASLSLQAECAKQALQQFNDSWARKEEVEFTNHYNEKMGKCFMRIQYWESSFYPSLVVQVFDAFDGKEYDMYKGSLTKREEPTWCSVTLPSGEERSCHSVEEFDGLVKPYM